MIDIVSTWDEFSDLWTGGPLRQNILLRGAMFPWTYQAPPLPAFVDELRADKATRILKGRHGLAAIDANYPEFREVPLAAAVSEDVSMAHFDARCFTGPGQALHGLEAIYDKWYDTLAEHGFSHDENNTQRAIFYGTPNCNTQYHFDSSYVLAWQIWGRKKFCWLKEPDKWCTREVLYHSADRYDRMQRPAGITPDDIVECEMLPGDVLWNIMLTPHWVECLDAPSYSFNITHFNLRHYGEMSPVQQTLEEIYAERWRAEQVEGAPQTTPQAEPAEVIS